MIKYVGFDLVQAAKAATLLFMRKSTARSVATALTTELLYVAQQDRIANALLLHPRYASLNEDEGRVKMPVHACSSLSGIVEVELPRQVNSSIFLFVYL